MRVFQISLDSLTTHRLRTFLTMLGVIFGVGAVVGMLSIGEGAKQEALKQIEILGINNIIINAKVPEGGIGNEIGLAKSLGLSIDDGKNIANFDEMIANVVPQRFEPISSISYGSEEAAVRVVATVPTFIYASSIEVDRGRFLLDEDNKSFAQVCVLGARAKRDLFAFDNPLGKEVRIGDLNFKVVGVMADKYIGRGKVEGFELKNFNEDVYIPFNTAQKKMEREPSGSNTSRGGHFFMIKTFDKNVHNTPELDQITVTVRDLKYVSSVTKLIESILSRRHLGVDDYDIVVPESLLRQTKKTQQIFNIVMGAMAGISLLVGGIGIMNIMLATVLERTREIGVRRAVGATRIDIMRQFLIEAVTICLLGCVVGLILGIAFAKGIAFYANWPTIVSFYSIALAVLVSTSVGIVFGLYPAKKAAMLNVIDALRYE